MRKNLSRTKIYCQKSIKGLNIAAMYMVRFYQYVISPLLGSNCRFYPSCSSYALLLLRFDNIFVACIKIFMRIFRCNPFFLGGFDYPSLYLSQRVFDAMLLHAYRQNILAKPHIKVAPKVAYFFVDSHSYLLKLKKFYIIAIHL